MATICKFLAVLISATALPLLSVMPTFAQERIALVIGNGKYVHATALLNPANDARAVAKALGDIGFTVAQATDLDRAGMERQLRDFLRKAASARVALLFYAGHGMQVDGKNYLVPVDAKLEAASDLTFETIELDKLLDNLNDPARANIVILDACRDNPLARSFAARLGPARSGAVSTGLAAYSALGTGTLIAFSTAPGKVADDGRGTNSPFTEGLLKHLATPNLEVRQMLTRVRADVAASTQYRQISWDNSSLLGEVYLASRTTAIESTPGAQLAPIDPCIAAPEHWRSVEATNTKAAYEDHLTRFPGCAFVGLARAKIEALSKVAIIAPPPDDMGKPSSAPIRPRYVTFNAKLTDRGRLVAHDGRRKNVTNPVTRVTINEKSMVIKLDGGKVFAITDTDDVGYRNTNYLIECLSTGTASRSDYAKIQGQNLELRCHYSRESDVYTINAAWVITAFAALQIRLVNSNTIMFSLNGDSCHLISYDTDFTNKRVLVKDPSKFAEMESKSTMDSGTCKVQY